MSDSKTFCIVGLGNPGKKYASTRHNVGWIILDQILGTQKSVIEKEEFKSHVFKTEIAGHKVYLVKPQTFMNLSGEAVGPLLDFYRIAPSELFVLHDELDLPPYTIKFKDGGGHAGHNGLRSIDAHLGTNQYKRIRLGIGHPRTLGLLHEVHDFVLGKFSKEEAAYLTEMGQKISASLPFLVSQKWTDALNSIHTKILKEA